MYVIKVFKVCDKGDTVMTVSELDLVKDAEIPWETLKSDPLVAIKLI